MKKLLLLLTTLTTITYACETIDDDYAEYIADNREFARVWERVEKASLKELDEIRNVVVRLRNKKVDDAMHIVKVHPFEIGSDVVLATMVKEQSLYAKAVEVIDEIKFKRQGNIQRHRN